MLKVVLDVIKVKNHCPGAHCFYLQIKLDSGVLYFHLILAGLKQSYFPFQWPNTHLCIY